MKEYPPKGPLQQYRKEVAEEFTCKRCKTVKKSKLVAVYNGNMSNIFCNSCYGELLSRYDVMPNMTPDDPVIVSLDKECRKYCK